MHKTNKETWIVIAVVLVVLMIIPLFFGTRNNYLMNIMVAYCYYGIMAASLNLVNGYSGQMSMGPGAFMAIGGYTYAILSKTFGVPIPLALLLGICHSFIWGLFLGLACSKLSAIFLGIASMGFSTALALFINNEGWLTGGANGFIGISRLVLFGHRFNNFEFYYVALAAAVLMQLLCYRLVYSKTGRALQAIRASPLAASAMGINVNMYKYLICGISAAMGGIAGCIYALNLTYLSADVFNTGNIMFLTMNAVGGGMGNLVGPIIGTFLVGSLPELLRPFSNHLMGVYGVLIVLMMRFMPFGIYGAFRQIRGKILARMHTKHIVTGNAA
jgi:branched-chain amino acid transport system permease protein